MSKKTGKKKVVVAKKTSSTSKKTLTPTVSKNKSGSTRNTATAEPLIFGKTNYIYMGVGAILITLGLFMMSGGSMPDPNTWDTDIIYGTRRTVIAPILILAGLIVEIVAIFK